MSDKVELYLEAVRKYIDEAKKSMKHVFPKEVEELEKSVTQAEDGVRATVYFDDMVRAQIPAVSLWNGNYVDKTESDSESESESETEPKPKTTATQDTFNKIVEISDIFERLATAEACKTSGVLRKIRRILMVWHFDAVLDDQRDIREKRTAIEKNFDVQLSFTFWNGADRCGPAWTDWEGMMEDCRSSGELSCYYDDEAWQQIHDKIVEYCNDEALRFAVDVQYGNRAEYRARVQAEAQAQAQVPQEQEQTDVNSPAAKRARVQEREQETEVAAA